MGFKIGEVLVWKCDILLYGRWLTEESPCSLLSSLYLLASHAALWKTGTEIQQFREKETKIDKLTLQNRENKKTICKELSQETESEAPQQPYSASPAEEMITSFIHPFPDKFIHVSIWTCQPVKIAHSLLHSKTSPKILYIFSQRRKLQWVSWTMPYWLFILLHAQRLPL